LFSSLKPSTTWCLSFYKKISKSKTLLFFELQCSLDPNKNNGLLL
jgi:hypothetical protein